MNKSVKTNERNFHLIDAKGQVLGRLASKAANLLIGKHMTSYVPNKNTGDSVIIFNADKIVLTGNKLEQKMDFRHSGYPRGDRLTPYKDLIKKFPERVIELAIKGMLPNNRLRQIRMRQLKVYVQLPSHLSKDKGENKKQ